MLTLLYSSTGCSSFLCVQLWAEWGLKAWIERGEKSAWRGASLQGISVENLWLIWFFLKLKHPEYWISSTLKYFSPAKQLRFLEMCSEIFHVDWTFPNVQYKSFLMGGIYLFSFLFFLLSSMFIGLQKEQFYTHEFTQKILWGGVDSLT